MSAPAAPAPAWRAARVRQFTGSAETLSGYLAEELARHPRRLVRAVRLALLASVGNGLMAAAHVTSALGPYLLWAVAAAPRPMMRPQEALRLVVTQGALLALSVPVAALLVEVPWFHVPFFAAFVALWAYYVRRGKLSNAWLLIGITVIDSLYAVIFDVRGFGWDTAATFGGGVIAFGTILLFDTVLWPDPAEPALLEAVARGLDRTRQRLALVRRAYFDTSLRATVPRVPAISDLPGHLTQLERVEREGATARHKSRLLAAITMNERVHVEATRLLVVTRDRVPATHRALLQPEIERVIDAVEAELAALSALARSGGGAPVVPASLREATAAALAGLDARSAAVQVHRAPGVDAAEVANLSSLIVGVRRMARVLDQTAEYPQLTVAAAPPRSVSHDPESVRWGLKLAAATVVMLVIALTAHSAELTAALWTVLIAGLPTHGATLRKMLLRLAGVLVGGAVAIAALVIVTPNFDTVLTYMIVCFAVFLPFAWAAQSSARLAYAGSQMGTTFTLVFAGLSPSLRVTEPLWRTWGVILGIVVTTVVFILLWPAYAGESMVPRLRRLLQLNVELIPRRGSALTDADIDARESESTDTLAELLAVADDARLEGARSGVNADAIIDAAGSLRRIGHRLGTIAAERAKQHALSSTATPVREAFQDRLAGRLRAWTQYFAGAQRFDAAHADAIVAAHRGDDLARALDDVVARVAAASYAEVTDWPLEARRSLLAELESFRRIVQLADELDQQLAAIPARDSGR